MTKKYNKNKNNNNNNNHNNNNNYNNSKNNLLTSIKITCGLTSCGWSLTEGSENIPIFSLIVYCQLELSSLINYMYTCMKYHNYYNTIRNTVEPVYSGHLGTPKNCPDYKGVLISQVHLYTFILQWDHN